MLHPLRPPLIVLYPGNPHPLLSSLSYGSCRDRENEFSYTIQKFSVDGLTAYMKKLGKMFGRIFGWRMSFERSVKIILWNKELGRTAVADDLDSSLIVRQALDKVVAEQINAAGVK